MIYSKLLVTKRIHKHLRLLWILAITSFLVGSILCINRIVASNGLVPLGELKSMQVVNLSPTGAGVVWSTKGQSTDPQWIEWGESMSIMLHASSLASGTEQKYTLLTGLSPHTTYYFRIRSSSGTYLWKGKRIIELQTPSSVSEHPQTPAYGKVLFPSGKPYANDLIFFEVEGCVPQAAYTKETGEWLIPLTGFVDTKTNSIKTIGDNTKVLIRVASIPETVVATTISQTRPLSKVIVVGTSIAMSLASSSGESVLGATTEEIGQTNKQPSIIYPKEGALIPGDKPLIKGTAIAHKELSVLIQGPAKQYSYHVVADEEGNWMVQSPLSLPAGNYYISATTQDKSGFKLSLRRNFAIIKSGEQVLGEATASAGTITPTQIPSPTPIPTVQSVTPTSTVIPTIVSSIIPTALPSLIPTHSILPTPGLPQTGGGISGYVFAATISIIIGAGLVLVF